MLIHGSKLTTASIANIVYYINLQMGWLHKTKMWKHIFLQPWGTRSIGMLPGVFFSFVCKTFYVYALSVRKKVFKCDGVTEILKKSLKD